MRGAAPTALAVALAAVSLAVIALLVPETPPRGELGDGDSYAAMAEHPLDPVAASPYAQRIAVPLVVWALPFGTGRGFLVVAVASLLAAAALVALVARELGAPPPGQVGAGVLTAASYIGVHGLYIPYYADPTTLAVVVLALWLALRGRLGAFAAVLAAGVLVKEVVATLVVVPYLLDPRRRAAIDLPAARRAAVAVAPGLAVFGVVHLLAPAADAGEDDLRLAFVEMGILARGFVTSVANPILALFGAAALLWPLGLLRGPAALRRLHVWAALALPLLAFGHMERTLGVFLPLALPAAFLVLRTASSAVTGALAAGSWWVTGVVGALTIGGGESSVAEKGALVAPGLVLALGAVAVHGLRVRRPAPAQTGSISP